MGVKYFFSWFKKTFKNHIKNIKITENILNTAASIDTFLIDLNGIFHYCAQKAFHYGSFSNRNASMRPQNYKKQLNYVFELTGQYIHELITFVKPKHRVVLCIDGVAPVSKQYQQRQRRFKTSLDMNVNVDNKFDSNSITPGTTFMDSLSRYLDWYIRMKMTSDDVWKNIEIIFSNEKVPGEGEHKLVKFVRDFGEKDDHFMIHGMDADLIMLALASEKENFHILRENPYKTQGNTEFFYINIKGVRDSLVNSLLHEPSMTPDQFYINDFILMMFMSGNDFLPHLPSIDILEGSIEHFFDVYRSTVLSYGNIVTQCNTIYLKPLLILLATLGTSEIEILEERRKHLKDSLLEKHTILKEDKFILNWEEYRKDYYATKLNCNTEKDIEKACVSYIEGMQWVLTYYLEGVSCWKWFYNYSYSPFSSDIAKYGEKIKYTDKICSEHKPFDPFFQLSCVLPPKSSSLLPTPLDTIMKLPKTISFYPEDFKIDMDGKRNDWEGVVILPSIDFNILEKEYKKLLYNVERKDKFRNSVGKTIVYKNDLSCDEYEYKSFFGNITNCKLTTDTILL